MNLIQLFAWVFVTLLISVTSHEGFCATNYFLVGEHVSNRQDSFILPLTRPENIAEARQNLELPREQRRSVAVSVVQVRMELTETI